jgi:GNAT superfamily N-acetyltransferase
LSPETFPVDSRKDLLEFIRFPRRLYRESPNFVPHLEYERKQFFDPSRNPFFKHAETAFYLVRNDKGETLGRISAHLDRNFIDFHGEKTGFFGFFDCVDDHSAAALLFQAAEAFLKSKGMERILGPMNFTTNDEVGILVKGFDELPFLMTPYNFPYYGSLVEKCGYRAARNLLAFHLQYTDSVRELLARLSGRVRRSARISMRHLDLKRFKDELELVKEIYNSAWEMNWGFIPMTDDEVEYLAGKLKPLVDPTLVYFAFVDGEPAGFFMALPDYNQVLRKMGGRLFPLGFLRFLRGRKKIDRLRVLTMGVMEKYRHLGIEAVFLNEIFRCGPARGIWTAELSWILEDNEVMKKISAKVGGEPYKVYRVYGKRL